MAADMAAGMAAGVTVGMAQSSARSVLHKTARNRNDAEQGTIGPLEYRDHRSVQHSAEESWTRLL